MMGEQVMRHKQLGFLIIAIALDVAALAVSALAHRALPWFVIVPVGMSGWFIFRSKWGRFAKYANELLRAALCAGVIALVASLASVWFP